MRDEHINRADFDQIWSELHQLAVMWRDRYHLSGKGIARLLLQYGTTFAFQTRVFTLGDVLALVKQQWKICLAELLPTKDKE